MINRPNPNIKLRSPLAPNTRSPIPSSSKQRSPLTTPNNRLPISYIKQRSPITTHKTRSPIPSNQTAIAISVFVIF